MSRGDQLMRQWKIVNLLQFRGEGQTLRALAEEFEVSERTIQRDLEIMQENGLPITFESDEVGRRYWRLPHGFLKSNPMILTLPEAVSLQLAERLIRPLAGTHFAEAMDSILKKVRAIVPSRALDYFADIDDIIHVRMPGRTDYSSKAETIRTLMHAARAQQTVEITYRSLWRGQETYTTLVDPYGLVLFEEDLFLVGMSHRAADFRVFKVSRILTALSTQQVFDKPDDYQLEDHFRSSFGIVQNDGEPIEIEVRFKGAAAALVEERVWHESQRLSREAPESLLFECRQQEADSITAVFRLSDLVEFKRWIRGFGDTAEVLRPESLRREMREDLLAAARQYGG